MQRDDWAMGPLECDIVELIAPVRARAASKNRALQSNPTNKD
jgi:hypothetical protein